MNALGEMYEAGAGTKRDLDLAIGFYRKAASLGDARAIYNLGRLIAGGQATPAKAEFVGESEAPSRSTWSNDVSAHSAGAERLQFAAALWRQSADAGDHLAEYRLAQLYEGGFGVPKDAAQALQLYRQAAPYVPEAREAITRLEDQ